MPSKPQVPGMIKGLGVTFGTMVQTMKPKKLGILTPAPRAMA